MNSFSLRKGMTFDWNGTRFRIDRLQPNGEVLLERVNDSQLVLTQRDQLLADYGQGSISAAPRETETPIDSGAVFSRPLEELPESVRQEATRRLHYLRFILEHGDIVFSAVYLRPLILTAAAEISDDKPPSIPTVHRWYSNYRRNRDSRSLIPRFDRRGAGKHHQDARILQLTTEAIQEAFKDTPKATGKRISERLRAKIEIENRRLLPNDRLTCPSKRTVYRMLARVEAFDMTVIKEGKAVADRRFRIGKAGVESSQILERVESDHTPLDLFLIDETTWLPLGRPSLTIMLDHYSRMPTGYYLSFDSPSTTAVMGALRHAILPKTSVAQVVPGLRIEHDWPCYGRPDALVVDNGLEFHGTALESVSFDLGMRIQYCPKRQPRFKGSVERYLKTVNYFFAHQLPGTSLAHWHERGDYDPLRHALLTLAEFKHIFEKWLLDIYAQEMHRGIGTTPWAKWHEGLKHREPELPGDLRQLQQRIGLVSERGLRQDGIWLNGIRYSGDVLQPVLNAYGAGVRVRVVFDPEDLGAIQVWGPNDANPITVHAMDQSFARNLTARQNEMLRTILRERGADSEDRAALDDAKNQLSTSIQELMASRKQRHRRQAAALRGLTSNTPEPSGSINTAAVAPPAKPTQRAKAPERPANDAAKPALPDCLPPFQLMREDD